MASTTDIIETLKYRYFEGNRARYLFNDESVVRNILKGREMRVDGRGQAILPLITQNAGNIRGITEAGSLPSALQPASDEATFSLQEYVAVSDVSWKYIRDAQRSEAAFQRAVELIEEGTVRRFVRMLNADLIDNGKGRLFVLPAADDQTTVTTDAPPLVDVGQVVDVMDLDDDDTKLGDSLTVSAVDPIALTVTLSGAPSGTAAGDYGVIDDTTDDSVNDALHTNGLISVVDDANPASVVGNYGGVNRTTAGNEFWEAVVLSNSGTNRSLTEDLLIQASDNARLKGGGRTTHAITNQAVMRRYHELLSTERFFSMSPSDSMAGGVGRRNQGSSEEGSSSSGTGRSVYDIGGIPFHVEPYFRPNTIVGIDRRHMWIGHSGSVDPQPISQIFDNIPFFRQTSNSTFEIVWYGQWELMTDAPSKHWKIEDVAQS